jgi:hypothetical protein
MSMTMTMTVSNPSKKYNENNFCFISDGTKKSATVVDGGFIV